MNRLRFSIGLQGNKTPREYICIARVAEGCDFDRIYVYDDLMYYPAFPILVTMAQHTDKISLGSCLLNGFYRHPAILATNYAYLYQMIGNRAFMGLGRGAFYDILGMNHSEIHTRKGFDETMKFVKHFLSGTQKNLEGELFSCNSNAFLKVPVPDSAQLVTATWNIEMAQLAGKYGTSLQIAEVWSENYMKKLYDSYCLGLQSNGHISNLDFSIGGMVCIGNCEKEALDKARNTVVIYLPYLHTILKNHNIDPESDLIKQISILSKAGKTKEAAQLIPDDVVRALSLTGTPKQVAERIHNLRDKIPFHGILFSPPYGTHDSIEENIRFIKKELIDRFL
jgi:5,10-methylenetetrahydromethanopterin reductase